MMVRLLSPACAACLVLLAAQSPAALPARPFERAEAFATCSGRMAALAARQRAHRDAAAGGSQTLAQMFDTLLDATMPDALAQGVPPGQGTVWRSRGWGEMAGLLSDMDQSGDHPHAVQAFSARIEARIEDCRRLVLPGG